MSVHLTAAQAKALGLEAAAGVGRARTTRKALPRGGAVTVCHTCGARFTGDTGEARHTLETGHARYDTDLTRTAP